MAISGVGVFKMDFTFNDSDKAKYASAKYSLNFICSTLSEELQTQNFFFLESFNKAEIKKKKKKMNKGDICLFENIRFCSEEEEKFSPTWLFGGNFCRIFFNSTSWLGGQITQLIRSTQIYILA